MKEKLLMDIMEKLTARLMGHSSIQTTMIYVSLDETTVIDEYKKHTA